MAVDAALMESVRAGGAPVLRFYRWSPACISLGRNQPARDRYDTAAIARAGVGVVRRPTGGRAVLHNRELTYSVLVREWALGSPRQAYTAINRAWVAGLCRLGVPAELQPRTGRRAPVPSVEPCFREPVEGEVVAGGRKLIGSAQQRERGVVLQHGSLLFHDDQRNLPELETSPIPVPGGAGSATLAEFVSPLPPWQALTGALAAGWMETFGGVLRPDALSAEESARAAALAQEFADPAWTWKR